MAGDWPGLLTRVQTQMQPLGPTSWGDRRFLGSVLACPVPHLHVKGLVFIMGARKDIRIDKIPDLDFQPGRCALQRAFQPCPPPIPTAPPPKSRHTHPLGSTCVTCLDCLKPRPVQPSRIQLAQSCYKQADPGFSQRRGRGSESQPEGAQIPPGSQGLTPPSSPLRAPWRAGWSMSPGAPHFKPASSPAHMRP